MLFVGNPRQSAFWKSLLIFELIHHDTYHGLLTLLNSVFQQTQFQLLQLCNICILFESKFRHRSLRYESIQFKEEMLIKFESNTIIDDFQQHLTIILWRRHSRPWYSSLFCDITLDDSDKLNVLKFILWYFSTPWPLNLRYSQFKLKKLYVKQKLKRTGQVKQILNRVN